MEREYRREKARRRVERLLSIVFIALAVVPPWHFWGIRWWVCLLVGVTAIFIMFSNIESEHGESLPKRIGHHFMFALMCGAPLWLYGYGGWRFLIYALVIGIIGVTVISMFSNWQKKAEFHRRYNQIQQEKRQRPDWTGKECMACGKPVPLSTKVGDYCPHCGKQFGRELRG